MCVAVYITISLTLAHTCKDSQEDGLMGSAAILIMYQFFNWTINRAGLKLNMKLEGAFYLN